MSVQRASVGCDDVKYRNLNVTDNTAEPTLITLPDEISQTLPSVDDIGADAPVVIPALATPPAAVEVSPPAAEPARPRGTGLQTGLVALVFLGIGLLGGAIAFGNRGPSTAEIETLVRSVVAEEMARVGTGSGTTNVSLVDDDPSFGPADAPITIVEFSDFYCTFCTRFATETLPKIQEQYGEYVRFVYRDLPIIGGQVSFDAAIAGNCAYAQGKFWEFHNILFAHNSAREQSAWIAFADELGMDAEAFTACLDDKAHEEEVTLDYLDGQGLGIQGTPAFFVNGRSISGAQPFNTFALVIDAELRKQGITPPERVEPET